MLRLTNASRLVPGCVWDALSRWVVPPGTIVLAFEQHAYRDKKVQEARHW